MITLIQIIGLITLCLVLLFLIVEIKKKGFDIYKISMLLIILILILMIIFQNEVYIIAKALGFLRPFELFITIVAVASLFFSFSLYIKQKRFEKRFTELSQNIGLERWKRRKN